MVTASLVKLQSAGFSCSQASEDGAASVEGGCGDGDGAERPGVSTCVHMALGDDKLLPAAALRRPPSCKHQQPQPQPSCLSPLVSDVAQDSFPGVGAVLCNWTLHFISSPGKRALYLQSLFDVLAPGGVLVKALAKRKHFAPNCFSASLALRFFSLGLSCVLCP